MNIQRNNVLELPFTSTKQRVYPFGEIELCMEVTGPAGTLTIPAFWKGGQDWAVRFAAPKEGTYTYKTVCTDATDAGLHGQTGSIDVTAYAGDNPLYQHGRLVPAGPKFQHEDGTPFFWLGDTWWMGLCSRMSYPEGLDTLIADRLDKGFTAVQIIAGLYPDMPPFDPRGANEAGFPWSEDFSRLNPEYFNMADRRIQRIIDSGLLPCIVGCWGYFIDFAGHDVLVKHWKNLIARYAAYPVVWCAAGEGTMPFYGYYAWSDEKNARYTAIQKSKEKREEYDKFAREQWTDITRQLKAFDPYHNLTSIHPGDYAHNVINDKSLLDYNMLQTGHGGNVSLEATVNMIHEARRVTPDIPVIDSEVCYEGIGGICGADNQRFAFLSTVMSGAAGFTYGGNGIWQLNNPGAPFGPSPHGLSWGYTTWQEAMNLQGSKQIGIAKKLMTKYPWQDFEIRPDWTDAPTDLPNLKKPYAMGIQGEIMLFYLPSNYSFGTPPTVTCLNDADSYRVTIVDLMSGNTFDIGTIKSQGGKWAIRNGNAQNMPVYGDEMVVLEKV